MKHIFFIWSLILWGSMVASPLRAQQKPDAGLMFPNAVISRFHYDKFKADIDKPDSNGPKTVYLDIKAAADKIINENRKTTPVKSYNNNPQNMNINIEMKAIYQLCVLYAFSQESKYLDKAMEYLKAWAAINIADPKSNIHEETYMQAVEGYSLIRKIISDADRVAIDTWIRKRINVFLSDNDLRWNNWGTCLLRQYYLCGLVLEEQAWIDKFKSEYPEWVKGNLFPNGTTTDLLGRDAFHYHSYDLLFFARICHLMGIYEGYAAMDEFYSRDIHWGASIRKSVDFWKPYLMEPKKNPHVEFVETDWEGDKTREDYNQLYKPSNTLYVMDELYEMDRDLKRVIDIYRKGNEFANWKSALSSVRWYYGEPAQDVKK